MQPLLSLKNFLRTVSIPIFVGLVLSVIIIKPTEKKVFFEVKKGESLKMIAKDLKEKGLIEDYFGFILLAKILSTEKKLQPGWYSLSTKSSPMGVLNALSKGKRIITKVTIPEGLNIEQIAHILKRKAKIDSLYFVLLCRDRKFILGFGINEETLEGYLLPDTYFVPLSEDASVVIRGLVANLFKFMRPYTNRMRKLGKDMHIILTIASLVEKEAMVDNEKPIIASVIYNRLKKGMRLQIDATVQYAMGEHKSRILFSYLTIDSPYNTYRIKGLPPGPICNPGRKSILAALFPAKTDYFYYVARGDGTHIFSRTFSEHKKAKFRVKRNQSKRR